MIETKSRPNDFVSVSCKQCKFRYSCRFDFVRCHVNGAPFTRDRIRVVSTSSSVSLRWYLLLPLFLRYALIKFCNIITNLRVKLVLIVFKLIWWPYGCGPVWTGSKPCFDVQGTCCVNARLGGKDRLRENLHKCYSWDAHDVNIDN